MRVDPVDQYKLAFSFGNRQYTWTRYPSGYSNSLVEVNIFLHKAMSHAASRGNFIYVDDILMRSQMGSETLKLSSNTEFLNLQRQCCGGVSLLAGCDASSTVSGERLSSEALHLR
ncbi:uncharacterized protein V6R79_024188 [Siganus canaliculatus]